MIKKTTIVCVISEDEYYEKDGTRHYASSLIIQYDNQTFGSFAVAHPDERVEADVYNTFKKLFKVIGLDLPKQEIDYPEYHNFIQILEENDFRILDRYSKIHFDENIDFLPY